MCIRDRYRGPLTLNPALEEEIEDPTGLCNSNGRVADRQKRRGPQKQDEENETSKSLNQFISQFVNFNYLI